MPFLISIPQSFFLECRSGMTPLSDPESILLLTEWATGTGPWTPTWSHQWPRLQRKRWGLGYGFQGPWTWEEGKTVTSSKLWVNQGFRYVCVPWPCTQAFYFIPRAEIMSTDTLSCRKPCHKVELCDLMQLQGHTVYSQCWIGFPKY